MACLRLRWLIGFRGLRPSTIDLGAVESRATSRDGEEVLPQAGLNAQKLQRQTRIRGALVQNRLEAQRLKQQTRVRRVLLQADSAKSDAFDL